jgi:acylphosphatase
MGRESATVRRHVVYHGRVQGVGFRWTASRIARSLRVCGYVQNRADGTVELVAEGPQRDVEQLLKDLSGAMAGNIQQADITEEPAEEGFADFSIRH